MHLFTYIRSYNIQLSFWLYVDILHLCHCKECIWKKCDGYSTALLYAVMYLMWKKITLWLLNQLVKKAFQDGVGSNQKRTTTEVNRLFLSVSVAVYQYIYTCQIHILAAAWKKHLPAGFPKISLGLYHADTLKATVVNADIYNHALSIMCAHTYMYNYILYIHNKCI